MNSLQPPDSFFVQAAMGWLEAGDHRAAQNELEQVAPALRSHPDVLEVRWAMHAHAGQWPACIEIAQELVSTVPERPTGWIKRSFVLHRLNRPQEALDALFPAAGQFSSIPIIPYNLACYATQLRCGWEAERWLKKAFETGGDDYRRMAGQDKELRALWPRLAEL